MRTDLASCLIAGFIGAALGWIGHSTLQRSKNSAPHESELTSQATSVSTATSNKPAPTLQPSAPQDMQSDAAEIEPQSFLEGSQVDKANPMLHGATFVLAPDRSSEALSIPSTDRSPSQGEADAHEDPLAELLNSMTIWCRFDPGNGASLREESVSLYELSYQGGPISYDSVDVESGTARMVGSAGATGSREGVLDVLVTATRAGLHFSAFNSRGELVVTTVFSAMDKHGRHAAVMTTHGTHALNGSYQTYGACNTGAPKPDA